LKPQLREQLGPRYQQNHLGIIDMTSIAILEAVNTTAVQFHGQPIITAMAAGMAYVAMKPIVENLGMSWGTQQQKLARNVGKFGCIHMNIPSAGGIQKMLVLPLKKLNGWLFSINPEKVRADIRDKLIQYQEECFTVLHDYWNKGEATNPRKKTSVDDRTPLRDAVNMLVSKKHLMYPEAYAMIHQRFSVDSIEDLEVSQIPLAIVYVHRVALEGELVERETDVKRLSNYNFPIESADPHDRRFGNDWVSAKVILDERNRAPELELIEALEKDGFDVSGIKVRIYAMYDVATRYLEIQSEFAYMKKMLSSMLEVAKRQSEERGINIIFSGPGKGGQIGGFKQRRLPR